MPSGGRGRQSVAETHSSTEGASKRPLQTRALLTSSPKTACQH